MSFRGRSVLVAGSTGLVGMALTRRLAAEGARVRATVHRTPPLERYEGVQYVQADLTREEDCRDAVAGAENVFIVAANTSGAAVMASTPLVHVTPNIVLNARLLQAAYDAGVAKVLWLGSTTGYPDTGARPVREEEMFAGDPYDAYFPVGWMKRYTEVLCRMYSEKLKKTMCCQVLRPTNIYGPFDKFSPGTSHVLAALIRKVVERQTPLPIWGTGDDVRDLIFVEDMVDACLTVIEKSRTYDPVNVGLGKGYSVKEMARLACELDGFREARYEFQPGKPSAIPVRLVDTSKAERVYGFKARRDLAEGLAETLRWYRANAGKLTR